MVVSCIRFIVCCVGFILLKVWSRMWNGNGSGFLLIVVVCMLKVLVFMLCRC